MGLQLCPPQINGPVAAIVAETDLSMMMIGGCFVVFLVVMIVISIVICRRINKLI